MAVNELINSYNLVHSWTWTSNDFLNENLKDSRTLFTDDSLQKRNPITKKLHVVAFLYGLPFSQNQQNILVEFQQQIKKILGKKLVYFVQPENLGLELAVLKWPEEIIEIQKYGNSTQIVSKELNNTKEVKLILNGFQINPDGCIVVRGIDLNKEFINLRKRVMSYENLFPKRQSGWAHIPLGRILEPVGVEKFKELKKLVELSISNEPIDFGCIGKLKLIDETQWYMEEHEILNEF